MTNELESRSERGTVGALDRAIRIVDELASVPDGMDLADIAAAVGMSASGTHRVLKSLVLGGVVAQKGRRGSYTLGPKIFVWSQQMRQEGSMAALATPILRELNEATGESVYLSVVRGGRMWNIVWLAGRGQLVVQARPGSEDLFHSTGRGKMFLAYMTPAAGKRIVSRTGLPKVGPATISEESVLWQQVERARQIGYAVSREESFEGGAGVAAPILDGHGGLLATIGASVPVLRFDSLGEDYFVEQVVQAAQRIQEAVNGEATQH